MTVGLLCDPGGFPLAVHLFEGNKAETKTLIPVLKEFQESHPATTAAYRRMVTSTRGVGYASCSDALAHWDFRDRLGEITVPVLVLAGVDDQSTPPSALKAIAEGVSGETTYVEVSPGAHVPTIEVPEQVTKALVDFFG